MGHTFIKALRRGQVLWYISKNVTIGVANRPGEKMSCPFNRGLWGKNGQLKVLIAWRKITSQQPLFKGTGCVFSRPVGIPVRQLVY